MFAEDEEDFLGRFLKSDGTFAANKRNLQGMEAYWLSEERQPFLGAFS